MWTSLINYFCDKLFSKNEETSSIRETETINNVYGKRMRLSDPNNSYKTVITQQRLPMQAKENVDINNVRNGDSDDDDCCLVIAEIPRRKKLGSTLNTGSELILDESSRCPRDFQVSHQILNDRDKSIVYKGQNDSQDSSPFSQLEKRKFFRTPRSCLSQSKAVKSNLAFRNQLKRKKNFLEECYRLTEKLQYIQLLKSQTSCLTLKNKREISHYPKPEEIPVVDLTDEEDGTSSEKLSKTCFSISFPSNKTDEDIQILKEVRKVRSFDDMIKMRGIKIDQEEQPVQVLARHESKSITALPSSSKSIDNDINDIKKANQESLEIKLRNLMQISESKFTLKHTKVDKCTLTKLSLEQEAQIVNALMLKPSNEVLTEAFGLRITRRDMHTLKGLNWLNDEIINFYMNLIMDRSIKNKNLPKVYAFNTFFYPKLVSAGYNSLKRWTKQVDIFSYDIILVPVHLGMHWCMSVIDFKSKFIKYFDSVGSPNDACLEQLLLYLRCECLDKKLEDFDLEGWILANVEDTPQQMNGSDCGVFSCMFAEYLARDAEIDFTQDDMPYFRKKIVIELLNKKLIT